MGKANIASATLLQTKLYLYTSYVLGGRVAKGAIPDALFWDTASPYHYLRLDPHRDYDYAIFGGEDHKTGQAADTEQCYRALERTLTQLIPAIDITHRWSGQVIETNDGLPFIGETASRQFAATGYAGNGMTFGTLGGMMARDAVLGRTIPGRSCSTSGRTKVSGGVWDYLKENVDYPYYMIRDRFVGRRGQDPARSLRPGQGRSSS